jgi:hypothetical protein
LVSHGGSIQQEEGHREAATCPAFLAGLWRSLHRAGVSATGCCATPRTSDFLDVFSMSHRHQPEVIDLFLTVSSLRNIARQNTDAGSSKTSRMLGNCGVR